MDLASLLQWNLTLFLLIVARWGGMIMLAPVFGARGVPRMIKLGLTACLAIILYPVIAATNPVIPDQMLPYVALLVKEILVGLTVGFIIATITSIIQGAGFLIDYQMGFMMANTIDPINGLQSPLTGNFLTIVATMLLLVTNTHHYLIAAMVKSYTYVPVNPSGLSIDYSYYAHLLMEIFTLAIQLAMPVIGAIVMADIGIGLLSRTVPQLNIFSVIFPSKLIFGLIILILSVPFLSGTVSELFNTTMSWVLELYRGWR